MPGRSVECAAGPTEEPDLPVLRLLAKCLALCLLAAVGVGGALLWRDYAGMRQAAPAPVATGPITDRSEPQPAASQPSAAAAPPVVVESAEPQPSRPTMSLGHQAGLHRVKDGLGLSASSALAVDLLTGEELFAKNPDAVLPVASLTKLMTALVLTQAKLPMSETVTITEDDVDRARNSRSRLRVGTVLTRTDALQLALMSSENRAAHALARSYPGGLDAFVTAMNSRARALGMKDTRYVDPTGLSEDNQSTARDVARLVAAASREPMIRTFSTTTERLARFDGRVLKYLNSNRLVKNPAWDIELQKTGYIVEAGRCVTMLTRIDGRMRILVVLDAGSRSSQSADAERLKRWVAAQDGDNGASRQAAVERQAKS
jgi:serine-type D-Ala-D-Ala endopeptidase (penicillin-binding protein 7)